MHDVSDRCAGERRRQPLGPGAVERKNMTIIRLRYVQQFNDRHGRTRSYFRRPGYPRTPLPGLPGSAEFMRAYQDALSGVRRPIGASRSREGTISALIAAYYGAHPITIRWHR